MEPEHLQQIMGYYLEDAKNHLEVIEQHLLNLQSTIEDPELISDLFRAVRCGIVGGANLLPISSTHISSIHQTGFCLVDCFKVIQHEGSLKVDQKLEDLLMQVFYALKQLIEPLSEPSGLTDDKVAQVMSEMELVRTALMNHLNWLVKQSRSANSSQMAIAKRYGISGATPDSAAVATPEASELAQFASDSSDDLLSLEDLQSVIDELSVDTP